MRARWWRSIRWPAGSASASAGANCSSPTRPRSQAEPVRSYICQATATISIWLAATPARRANHSSTKPRWAKSDVAVVGVLSARSPRLARAAPCRAAPWPRARAAGWSLMRPSTPQPMRRSICAGSFTVHGITFRPSACASASSASVSSPWKGDQVPAPSAFTSRGTEPPWSCEPQAGGPARVAQVVDRRQARRQRRDRQPGRQPLHGAQRAPVEALHRDALGHAVTPHDVEQRAREGLGLGRQFRRQWRELGLDVEAHLRLPAGAHQLEQRLQRRHALAVGGR